jgi:hypothetical protein
MQKVKRAAAITAVAAVTGAGIAAPASAAAAPLFMQNAATGSCIVQTGTTTDIKATNCTDLWTFVPVSGGYTVVNYRTGWCLSAPNGYGSRIYAEYCVTNPVPKKQKWTPSITGHGYNLLVSAVSSAPVCLRQGVSTAVWADPCNGDDANQGWLFY